MSKLGDIEILQPTCNLTTIEDGRGGIFTWLPREPLFEFNFLYFRPNKVRGNHFHPEFIEYFLVVEGSGVIVTPNPKGGEPLSLHVSTGTCIRTPIGVAHAFHAITDVKAVSLLTKPWDECKEPIVHEALIEFDKGYQEYAKENLQKNKKDGDS